MRMLVESWYKVGKAVVEIYPVLNNYNIEVDNDKAKLYINIDNLEDIERLTKDLNEDILFCKDEYYGHKCLIIHDEY